MDKPIPVVRALLLAGLMFLLACALQSYWFEHNAFFHLAWVSGLYALVAAVAYCVGHVHREAAAYKFEHAYTFGSLYFVGLLVLHNLAHHPQLPFLYGYVQWAIVAGASALLYLIG